MFLANLGIALLWTVGIKVAVINCGHRITWRLALLLALFVVCGD